VPKTLQIQQSFVGKFCTENLVFCDDDYNNNNNNNNNNSNNNNDNDDGDDDKLGLNFSACRVLANKVKLFEVLGTKLISWK
jgi:hypothetical protein